MNKLTIVLPVFNVEMYLKKSLESILSQDSNAFDLLIINDGSTDNSESLILDLIQNRKNITYISQKNKGISYTRNLGIELSKTEYIYFMDSDDFIEKDLVSNINNIIEENRGIELIVFGFNIINNKKNSIKIKKAKNTYFYSNQNEISKSFLPLMNELDFNSVWNKVYKKTILVDNSIYFDSNIKISEDSIFNTIVLKNINNMWKDEQVFYNYIIERPQSAMTKIDINTVISKIKAIEYWESLLIAYGISFNIRNEKIINIIYYEIRKILNSEIKLLNKIEYLKLLLNNELIKEELNKIELINKNKNKNKNNIKIKLLIIKLCLYFCS